MAESEEPEEDMTESKQDEEAVTKETEQRNYVNDGAFVLVMAAFAYWWFFEISGFSVAEFTSVFLCNAFIFFLIILPLMSLFGKKD